MIGCLGALLSLYKDEPMQRPRLRMENDGDEIQEPGI